MKSGSKTTCSTHSILFFSLSLVLTLCGPFALSATGQGDVLTQHNDNSRRGANLEEKILTTENVKKGKNEKEGFGRLFSRDVEGFIYAQPLYVANVRISTKDGSPRIKNLVIIATCKNYVYAFDADSTDKNSKAKPEWMRQLPEKPGLPKAFFDPLNPKQFICPLTTWPIGITSTPVIDRDNNRLYVVARNNDDGTHWLHVLDLENGQDLLQPKKIEYSGNESSGPSIAFDPTLHLNRPGLLLLNGKIYLAFGSMCDRYNSHGWVFSYDAATLTRTGVFCTSPNVIDSHVSGGVWQSGNGLAADDSGNIYLMTGNGEFNPAEERKSFGSSFLQLHTGGTPNDLSLVGYFAPNNQAALSTGDVDLGSGGPMLLPGGRVIGGGKQGRLYILAPVNPSPSEKLPALMELTQNKADQMSDKMDGVQAFFNTHHQGRFEGKPCRLPQVEEEDNPIQVEIARLVALFPGKEIPYDCYGFNQYYGPNIHGGPLYWEPNCSVLGKDCEGFGVIYGTAEKDYIKAFKYNLKTHEVDFDHPFAISTVRAPDGMPGGILSLSANGDHEGIIWASYPKRDNTFWIQRGRLVALNAANLQTLWSDDDSRVRFAKFSPPTIADGKVFRAAFGKNRFDKGKLFVYGLCTPANPCVPPQKECKILNLFRKIF
jgi:hypothetical protein